MSAGSPILCVRIVPLVLASLDQVISEYNAFFPENKLSRSLMLQHGLAAEIDRVQRIVAEKEIESAKPAKRKSSVKRRLEKLSKKIHA